MGYPEQALEAVVIHSCNRLPGDFLDYCPIESNPYFNNTRQNSIVPARPSSRRPHMKTAEITTPHSLIKRFVVSGDTPEAVPVV